jgi:hypothetical protein
MNKNGRDDWIRTSDLTHPKGARYQASLRPDRSVPSSLLNSKKTCNRSKFSENRKAKKTPEATTRRAKNHSPSGFA